MPCRRNFHVGDLIIKKEVSWQYISARIINNHYEREVLGMLNFEKARKKMQEENLDALVALSILNVRYATGYFSMFCYLVKEHVRPVVIPRTGEPFVICPDHEIEDFKANSQIKNFVSFPTEVYMKFNPGTEDHHAAAVANSKKIDLAPLKNIDFHTALGRRPLLFLAKELNDRGLDTGRIGMDSIFALSVATWNEVQKALPYAEILDATEIFSDLRKIKTPEEIRYIGEASKLTKKAIKSVIAMAEPGMPRSEIVAEAKRCMIGPYSEPFELALDIAGGPSTAFTDEKFQKGQILDIDLGAKYKNYCADFSRMVAIGEPSKEFRKMYDALVEAEEQMIGKIKPGVRPSDIYDLGMSIMRRADPDYRRGHIGHGIGLELHEKPYVGQGQNEPLEEGMVMTVEIPYYRWGSFGINMEDTFVVTKNGIEYAGGDPISRELVIKGR